MRTNRRGWDRWIGLIAGWLMLAGWVSSVDPGRIVRGENDFLSFYSGSVLCCSASLHDPKENARVQVAETGALIPAVTHFVRPDYYALLLKPLSYLPFKLAYAAFQLLNLLALIMFLAILREKREVLWLAAVSIPIATSFINGQDVPLLLAALGGFVALLRSRRPVTAGLLLSLCTIKFHLFLFVPLALLFWRQWKVLGGATVGTLGLIAAAMVCQGVNWPIVYAKSLRNPEIHPAPFQFMNARGLEFLFGSPEWPWIPVLLGIIGVACLARMRQQGRSIDAALAISMTGGLLVSYHLGIHDCSLLLAVVALADDEWLRWGAALLSIPVPYYLLMLDGVAGALPAIALTALMLAVTWRSYRRLARTSAG